MNAPRLNKLKAAMQGMQAINEQPTNVVPINTVERKSVIAQSRIGKRVISAYIVPEAARQLKLLATENDRTVQDLIEEAINDVFRKYGKSALA